MLMEGEENGGYIYIYEANCTLMCGYTQVKAARCPIWD